MAKRNAFRGLIGESINVNFVTFARPIDKELSGESTYSSNPAALHAVSGERNEGFQKFKDAGTGAARHIAILVIGPFDLLGGSKSCPRADLLTLYSTKLWGLSWRFDRTSFHRLVSALILRNRY